MYQPQKLCILLLQPFSHHCFYCKMTLQMLQKTIALKLEYVAYSNHFFVPLPMSVHQVPTFPLISIALDTLDTWPCAF